MITNLEIVPVANKRAQLVVDGNPIPLKAITVLTNRFSYTNMERVRNQIRSYDKFLEDSIKVSD